MSRLVIDFNKLFSALLHANSHIQQFLLQRENTFFMPSFAVLELFKHKERLSKMSRLDADDLLLTLGLALENIHFVPVSNIKQTHRDQAWEWCHDVDKNDVAYIALELDCPLWTGDQKLKSGLRAKGVDIFFEFSPL